MQKRFNPQTWDKKMKKYSQQIVIDSELSIQLCVLTAYLAAKESCTEEACFEMMEAEIKSRPSVIEVDRAATKLQISTGFCLYKNHPELTNEQIFDMAVELYISMLINRKTAL
jgi:hypothetical protein